SIELDARFNKTGKEEYEEDKGAENDDAGEELALGDEAEDENEEEEGESGGGDHVWQNPGSKGRVS
ncbi:MAG: hypothetical protein Q9190_005112, partial [Brigantiaea leucoxantha]